MRAAQRQGVLGRGPDDDVVPIGEPDDDDYDGDDDIDEEEDDDEEDPLVVGRGRCWPGAGIPCYNF